MKRIRILISSPGDVTAEREQARAVIAQLQRRYAGRLELEPILWEELPLQADMSFQEGIDVVLSGQGVDVALFILWSRLGSPLGARVRRPDGGDYRSGTERELDLMLHARERSGGAKPAILVYVRDDERSFKESMLSRDHDEIEQMIQQRRAVEQFIREQFHDVRTGANLRAYHGFSEPATFAIRLRQHLRQHLDELLPDGEGVARARWEGSPFLGLLAFQFKDAEIFHGREREVDEVLLALHRRDREGCAFLLILGASGSGKSSLVRAGVIPQLVLHPLSSEAGPWRWAALTPGVHAGDLIGGLTRALAAETALPALRGDAAALASLAGALVRDPRGAWELRIREALDQLNVGGKPARLVLAIDQLEECFTHPAITAPECESLFAALDVLARSGRVWVLATLRSDAYQACQRYPSLMALKGESGQFDLLAPTPADLRRIITEPARLAGLRFERDPRTHHALDERILTDAAGHADALPLLEFALDRLYERRTAEGELTFEAYERIGRVEGALREHAEELYQSLPERARRTFDTVMSALVTVQGSDQAVTRRRARMDELALNDDQRALVEQFTQGRILVADRDETGRATLTVAHEALLAAWPRLADWIARNQDLLRVRARVDSEQAAWEEHGRDERYLLAAGIRLSEGEDLLAQWGDRLSPGAVQFISQSASAARAAELRGRRRDRRIKLTLACLLLVAAAALIAAMGQTRKAERARNEAVTEADRARRAQAQAAIKTADLVLEEDPHLSKAYLASAIRLDPTSQVASLRLADHLLNRPTCWPLTKPLQHADSLSHAGFSPDGSMVVTASRDGTARIWDAATGEPLTEPLQHGGIVNYAEFSPDGSRIVTASNDNCAIIWDVATGEPLTRPLEHQGLGLLEEIVGHATFSADGSRVVTASGDRTAQIWDAWTGNPLTGPLRHGEAVLHAAFSADGSRVITASGDQTARIWNAATGEPMTDPLRHGETVRHVVFSADGSRVATASFDHTARIWNPQTGEPFTDPLKHGGRVFHAEFSSDSSLLVTASDDNTARIWDTTTGNPLTDPLRHGEAVDHADLCADGHRLITVSGGTARIWELATGELISDPLGHGAPVHHAEFSADGSRAVTASSDGTARIWDVATGELISDQLGHEAPVCHAELSADGTRVVISYADYGPARIWDVATGELISDQLGHEAGILHVEFSADGSQVVTASYDQTARVWDAATGIPLTGPLPHEGNVLHAAFNPDGTRVVTAASDGTARIWDVVTGKPLTDPLPHGDTVRHAAFSPDGSRVVTASEDDTARIWDAATGKPLTDALQHEGAIHHAAFSPDGNWVVTASADNTAQIWEARTGAPLIGPLQHKGSVRHAEFSPDGSRVVTASFDGTARIWDAVTGERLSELQHDDGDHVYHAAFSAESSRVVTASSDGTARIWDALTGEPLTEPLQHVYSVGHAAFSADGTRVCTFSINGTARIWDLPPTTPAPEWLADLAEALAGRRINERGLVETVDVDLLAFRRRLQQLEGDDPWSKIGRWLAADARTRTISPYSSLTVPQYIERAIKSRDEEALHQAELLAYGDETILARIRQRRAELQAPDLPED